MGKATALALGSVFGGALEGYTKGLLMNKLAEKKQEGPQYSDVDKKVIDALINRANVGDKSAAEMLNTQYGIQYPLGQPEPQTEQPEQKAAPTGYEGIGSADLENYLVNPRNAPDAKRQTIAGYGAAKGLDKYQMDSMMQAYGLNQGKTSSDMDSLKRTEQRLRNQKLQAEIDKLKNDPEFTPAQVRQALMNQLRIKQEQLNNYLIQNEEGEWQVDYRRPEVRDILQQMSLIDEELGKITGVPGVSTTLPGGDIPKPKDIDPSGMFNKRKPTQDEYFMQLQKQGYTPDQAYEALQYQINNGYEFKEK